MRPTFSLTASLDFDRLLKLRLVVARYGEMDMARWWNTQGTLGLPGIGQKQLQGTTYHLHNDSAFLRIVASDDEVGVSAEVSTLFPPPSLLGRLALEPVTALSDWVERGTGGQIGPKLGCSTERQLEVHKDTSLGDDLPNALKVRRT